MVPLLLTPSALSAQIKQLKETEDKPTWCLGPWVKYNYNDVDYDVQVMYIFTHGSTSPECVVEAHLEVERLIDTWGLCGAGYLPKVLCCYSNLSPNEKVRDNALIPTNHPIGFDVVGEETFAVEKPKSDSGE